MNDHLNQELGEALQAVGLPVGPWRYPQVDAAMDTIREHVELAVGWFGFDAGTAVVYAHPFQDAVTRHRLYPESLWIGDADRMIRIDFSRDELQERGSCWASLVLRSDVIAIALDGKGWINGHPGSDCTLRAIIRLRNADELVLQATGLNAERLQVFVRWLTQPVRMREQS